MQTVRKYLVYGYVPVMVKTYRNDTRESCVGQRSVYIILGGNEETKRIVNQVRNVLRHLLDRIFECTLIRGIKFEIYLPVLYSLMNFLKERNVGLSTLRELQPLNNCNIFHSSKMKLWNHQKSLDSYNTISCQRMLLKEIKVPRLRSHCKCRPVITLTKIKMLIFALISFLHATYMKECFLVQVILSTFFNQNFTIIFQTSQQSSLSWGRSLQIRYSNSVLRDRTK